jgi:hypothetical protein
MLWAKRSGKARFVLGGGHLPDDGIFRYKRSFAPEGVVPFRVGQRILDQGAYDCLLEARSKAATAEGGEWIPQEGFFPAYRSPNVAVRTEDQHPNTNP